jgi:type IV pilus assembly protein PilM
MPSSTVCWGIEVGANAIKALKLEADGEGVKVLDFAVAPHKRPLSTPGIDPSETVGLTLRELVAQHDIGAGGGTAVAMSVPGHSAFARFAKLPPVDPKKVPDIVKFEAVQQIPFPLEQVEWDYQTFRSDDSPDIEVGIFAITRERIMERLAMYEDVEIVPDFVTLSSVAAFNALAYDLAFTERTPGTIILDIGTTSTDLVIAEAGRVWIRTVPIGGHNFTEALVNSFQLSYPKAEKLKKEAESSKHARHIFQAMRPIFGDLAQEVQRSIGYYQSLHKDAKLERLIGLGSTFRLPGLRKYLKQQVGMDVFRLEQFKRLSMDGPRAGELQASTLNLATAYGLALQGLGMATLEANLMPTTVVREAMWERKVKWFAIAACVAVAAGLSMFIRPFLDSQAVAADPPPQSVKDAISEGQRLKSQAADVTGATIENSAAAGVLALLESRGVFGYMVNDVAEMLDFAQETEKLDEPVFEVKEYKAREVRPRPTSGHEEEAPQEQRVRLAVTMKVTTTRSDPQRLAYRTLDEWLRRNATREGVPYEIVIAANPTKLAGTTETGPLTGTQPSGPGMLGGGDVAPPVAPPRTGGRFGAGAGTGPAMGSGDTGSGEGMAPGPMGPGASGAPGASPLDQSAAAALQFIRQVAPLTPPPEPPAGTRVHTFEVAWDVVLLPAQGNTDGGGN